MWQGVPPAGYNNQFRIFDEKLTMCQKVRVFFVQLVLNLLGGIFSFIPIIGSVWPFGQILPWYLYTVKLSNMKFGGSDPYFDKEMSWSNYIYKYYTIAVCGLCGMALKRWVDANVRMGEVKFDEEMAKEDEAADAANPNELNRRFTNQSVSGPPGFLDPGRSVSFAAKNGGTNGVQMQPAGVGKQVSGVV